MKRILRQIISKLPKKTRVSIIYLKRTKKHLNLTTPKRFNEKIQWLKLNWFDEKAQKCADKYLVREYVKNTIGSQYLNELISVYTSVEEIDIDKLPNKFVLKATHGSGFNMIVKDKSTLNWKKEKKTLKKWLETDYSLLNDEWVYKDLTPRIICEKYLEDKTYGELRDYKFFTFNGKVKFMFVASGRSQDLHIDYFDLNFKRIPVKQKYPSGIRRIDKPNNFEKMIELSEKLASGFPHVRVDFFECNGRIYFSELTFFNFSGCEVFVPDKYDLIFGEYLDIESIKENNKFKAI